ncbi:MAG: hypothetical protein A4E45_00993 [Methanosaeta sp. PtaB.Bin039]|nr:MAG: hypothetical protein A4E45_00993 [Methanosaeta sp. PtaB.Bin039]OPY44729.1 MAG: hypothetical protein A4E47_01356 [Methanosaeta sp. PtaU1.Bin028]
MLQRKGVAFLSPQMSERFAELVVAQELSSWTLASAVKSTSERHCP